jgi:hypothetical protein
MLIVSVFFLVMLSVDRFILIMPADASGYILQLMKRARNHPKYVRIVSITIWCAALFLE